MANRQTDKKVARYQTTVRLDRYEELKQMADEKKWSFNTVLNDAIEFYLAHRSQQEMAKVSSLSKSKAHLLILNNDGFSAEWKVPENKLDKGLFRIQVAEAMIEFFELGKRGQSEVVNELLNPYERGIEDEINGSGYRYEHPAYDQGHKDYIATKERA